MTAALALLAFLAPQDDPGPRAPKREVYKRISFLLNRAYIAYEVKRFDRCIQYCDAILLIDAHYTVAKEIKEDVEKTKRREEYYEILRRKMKYWREFGADSDGVPYSRTIRFPSARRWSQISKRIERLVLYFDLGLIRSDSKDAREVLDVLARELNRTDQWAAKREFLDYLFSYRPPSEMDLALVRKCLDDLHSDDLDVRDRAAGRLDKTGRVGWVLLKKADRTSMGPDARARVDDVLKKFSRWNRAVELEGLDHHVPFLAKLKDPRAAERLKRILSQLELNGNPAKRWAALKDKVRWNPKAHRFEKR